MAHKMFMQHPAPFLIPSLLLLSLVPSLLLLHLNLCSVDSASHRGPSRDHALLMRARTGMQNINTTMKLLSAVACLLSFLSTAFAFELFKRADETTSALSLVLSLLLSLSSASYTSIWVTITTNGALATVQTTFVQSFMTTYSEATLSAASGSIGLGSLSGDTGETRTYSQTTVSAGANQMAYSGAFGALLVLFSLL